MGLPFENWKRLYLECVGVDSDGKKHNKYYEMIEDGKNHLQFKAAWGPIGKVGTSKPYFRSDWQKQLSNKLDKGKGYVVIEADMDDDETGDDLTLTNPQIELIPTCLQILRILEILMTLIFMLGSDRRLDVSIYKFATRFTQLTLMLKDAYMSNSGRDEAIELFEIRKTYWKNRKLTKGDMEYMSHLYNVLSDLPMV